MTTQCTQMAFDFYPVGSRDVVADFEGGTITSDAGGLLLRELEGATTIIQRFADCFRDHRDSRFVEHSVTELIAQRVYALALGYEDLNDHEQLRKDPLLATLVGKLDPSGRDRNRQRDQNCPLAGKSTLNRLELTPKDGSENRYKKISLDGEAVDRFFVETFLQAHKKSPERIVLDFDATDDPLHGKQEGRFFHGYYRSYCYLPLYVFCGDFLLAARLRESNIDAAKGTVEELERIVTQIRQVWPEVEIILRGDSGFCRDAIMVWCEENQVEYVLGLAKNERLKAEITDELAAAEERWSETKEAARVYKSFSYSTLKTWSRERRVIGKAEHLPRGSNPRFVVTSLPPEGFEAPALYEFYCARGDMENRIKEQQLDMFADRTSTHFLWSNQIRLWLSSVAYALLQSLRHYALGGTELAKAQCGTIRLRLLKIGAQVRVSVRRVYISMASGYPFARLFEEVYRRLRSLRPRPAS